jgi:hypothetical protein
VSIRSFRLHLPRVLALLAVLALPASAAAQAPSAPPPSYRVTLGAQSQSFAWAGDVDLAAKLAQVSDHGGATIDFGPGVFEFGQGINLEGARDLHFRGQPGTVFRFRKLDEWGRIVTTGDTPVAEKTLAVNHPELFRAGARYQLFFADQHGNRFLECVVGSVAGGKAKLSWSYATHPGLTVIPAGAYVVPEINFFDTFKGGDLSFSGIAFDGNCRIAEMQIAGKWFYGHTTHSGIIVRNNYKAPETRPATRRVTIEKCAFRNLLGRGVAIYNVAGVTIRDCEFEDVRVEAAEMDHWSREGVIQNCRFARCGIGIQLNDCNDVVVSDCRISECETGIRVLDSLHDLATNRFLVVRSCIFAKDAKAVLSDPHADDDLWCSNVFRDCGPVAVTLAGDRNVFTSNLIQGSTEAGVEVLGKDCVVESNAIVPPAPAGGFIPVRKPDQPGPR